MYMFGYFGMTPYHNVVHLGFGALWLLAALVLTPPAAQGINLAIGGALVLVAIIGYFGFLHFLGIHNGVSPDNILHLVTGVVTLAFAGIVPTGHRARTARG
jgi:MFS superfamily sulfate permease-like transporter